MFNPKFAITNKLLSNIKEIGSIITELNNRKFSNLVLVEMERLAREISSHASTSIEGNPLPLTDVKRLIKTDPKNIRDSEKEVLNYNNVLKQINKNLKNNNIHFSLDLILKIQKGVVDDLLPDYDTGVLRKRPVFVNNPSLRKVVYLPPDHSNVPLLIDELIMFIKSKSDEIDPIILAGIFHKQFVLIHPFIDGNGRTTRLLTKILLAEMGLNTFNLFSFENYYNKNVTRYFEFVGEIGNYYELSKNVDFTKWLEYFTDGIIDELLRVKKILSIQVDPKNVVYSHDQKVLDFVEKNGFIKNSDYAKLIKRSKAMRVINLNRLIEMGLIERKGKGKATFYVLKKTLGDKFH
ncbi:MAG: Fic family protein [Patescibacteria group bacterium]